MAVLRIVVLLGKSPSRSFPLNICASTIRREHLITYFEKKEGLKASKFGFAISCILRKTGIVQVLLQMAEKKNPDPLLESSPIVHRMKIVRGTVRPWLIDTVDLKGGHSF